MTSTMRALRCLGGDRVELTEMSRPVPGQGEALVRILVSALCGSERSAFADGHATNAGHEAAGVVEFIDDSEDFEVGDLVGLGAVTGCGRCDRCGAGRETQCRLGPSIASGWHSEYAVVPITALRRSNSENPVQTVLASGDALGVPARALRRAPSPTSGPIVVIGLGPIGLSHVLIRAGLGSDVIGIEPSEARRALALELGASAVYAPGDFTATTDLVLECTGVPQVIESALQLVDTGGTVMQSGECHRPIAVVPSDVAIRREITYLGSWFYASEDLDLMRRLAQEVRIERLCTLRAPADDAQVAIDAFLAGTTGKAVLEWA